MQSCPEFERLLVRSGIILLKYWFSVSDDEQERRFQSRTTDPARRWKLSPMDLESRDRWVEYSQAKDEMFAHTNIPEAPWFTVEANDKKTGTPQLHQSFFKQDSLRRYDARSPGAIPKKNSPNSL